MAKKLLVIMAGVLLGLGLGPVALGQPHRSQGRDEMPPEDFMLPEQYPQRRRNEPRMTPEQYRQREQKAEARRRYLERLRWQDHERYHRILDIYDLAREYRFADSEARRQRIEKKLKPLLAAELKAQQDEARKRVDAMEKKLEQIRKILKQRDEHWDQVLEFQFKKVTGQIDYLEFEPAPLAPGPDEQDQTLEPKAPARPPQKPAPAKPGVKK